MFRGPGELDSFAIWARESLRAGCGIKKILIVADEIDQVRAALVERDLLPAGRMQVAVEGTDFFDEVFAQLLTDTLWPADVA